MSKKKEEERRTKIDICTFDFLNCEKEKWNSGIVLYIRIAKGFHLLEFCITLLCLSWSCSNTLSTGCHLNQSNPYLRSTIILLDD